MDKIETDADYEKVMASIEMLMTKGSQNVSKDELEEIRALALLAQAYEQEKYVFSNQ